MWPVDEDIRTPDQLAAGQRYTVGTTAAVLATGQLIFSVGRVEGSLVVENLLVIAQ